jgi:hypothetical protein
LQIYLKVTEGKYMPMKKALRAAVEGYGGGEGAEGSFRARGVGNVVTVEGSVINARETLRLEIPGGLALLWRASITSAPGFPGPGESLLELSGGGSFVVTEDGSVSAPGRGGFAIRQAAPPRRRKQREGDTAGHG